MSTKVKGVSPDGGEALLAVHGDAWVAFHPIALVVHHENIDGAALVEAVRINLMPDQAEEIGAALIAVAQIERKRKK